MVEIPIKINKLSPQTPPQIPHSNSRPNERPTNTPQKRPASPNTESKAKWLVWLFGAALIAQSAWLGYSFLTNRTDVYKKLIPQKNLAVTYFQPAQVLENFRILKTNGFSWPPFLWAADFTNGLLQNTELNWSSEQLISAFEEKMVFVLLTDKSNDPKWLFLSSTKIPSADFIKELGKAENSLKFKYNLITELYRQTKITRVKHLNQNPHDIYFAYLKNYLIISNDDSALKETLSKIMDL